jgi:hypothetical protein
MQDQKSINALWTLKTLSENELRMFIRNKNSA